MLSHSHSLKLREGLFEIVKLEGIWPVILVRRAEDFEDFEDLVDLTVSHE